MVEELGKNILLLVLGFLGGLFSPIRIGFGTIGQPTQEDFEDLAEYSARQKKKYAELEVVASMIAAGATEEEVLNAMTDETRKNFGNFSPNKIKVRRVK